jgi:hypothetical protein
MYRYRLTFPEILLKIPWNCLDIVGTLTTKPCPGENICGIALPFVGEVSRNYGIVHHICGIAENIHGQSIISPESC